MTGIGIDILLIAPVIYGIIHGILRGFVQEVVSIIALILAVVAAKLYYGSLAAYFMSKFDWNDSISHIIAFLVIFFAVAMLLNLLAYLLSKLLKAINLGWLNTIFGAIFGAAKWALIVSILLNGIILLNNYFQFIAIETIQGSHLWQPMSSLASWLWDGIVDMTKF